MKHLLAIVAVAGLAAPAFAQMIDFTSVDADQSGTLTLEELQAVLPDVTQEQFTAADADGSGDLTQEEFAMLAGG